MSPAVFKSKTTLKMLNLKATFSPYPRFVCGR